MIEGNKGLEKSRKLEGLQAGRGIAAVAVVLTHAMGHPFPHAPGLIALPGDYGVSLFFLISGFIMVRTTGAGRFNPVEFLKHRLLRIVPVYYIACALLATLAAIAPGQFKTTVLNVPHIILSLLFIPSYAPREPGAIFPFYKLGWTLNFEMFFYVVFALFAFTTARRRIGAIAVIFALLVVIGQVTTFDSAVPSYYTRSNIIGFVAGMILATLRLTERPALSKGAAAGLFVASTLALIGLAMAFDIVRQTVWEQVWLVAITFAQGVLLLGFVDRDGRKVPSPLLYLGDASYSIYLFHMFAVGPVHAVFKHVLPGYLPVAMGFAMAGGLVAGLLAYRFVERPIVRRLKPRRPVTALRAGEQQPQPRAEPVF